MELLVLDSSFKSIAVVESYESLIWTERYFEVGDFELYLSDTPENFSILQVDNYLWNKESEYLMIIEDIRRIADVDEGNKLLVSGRSLESILDRRILWGKTVFGGSLQDGIQALLNENIIAPSVMDRQISNFIFEASTDPRILAFTHSEQFTRTNLLETIRKICLANNLGYSIKLNASNQLVFKLYLGLDRSYEQSVNPYVIFSSSFDTLIDSEYSYSKRYLKNVTLVAGEGEDLDRKTTVVGAGSGLERRELYTDANDIAQKVDDVALSDAEYCEQLSQRGVSKLSEHIIKEAFDAEAEINSTFKYGEDFFMGDLVQFVGGDGTEAKVRVVELVRSKNKSGIETYPKFSIEDIGEYSKTNVLEPGTGGETYITEEALDLRLENYADITVMDSKILLEVSTVKGGQDSLLPYIQSEWEVGGIEANGALNTNNLYIRTKTTHVIKPSTEYILQCSEGLDPINTIIFFYTSADVPVSYVSFTGGENKITTPSNAVKFKVRARKVDATVFPVSEMPNHSVRVTRNATLNTLTEYSKITQTNDAIVLEIGKIKVGGKNFVPNSTFADGLTGWGNSGSTLFTTDGVSDLNSVRMIGAMDSTKYVIRDSYFTPSLVSGDEFIASCYIKGTSVVHGTINPFTCLYVVIYYTDSSANYIASSQVPEGTFDWTRYIRKFTIPTGKTVNRISIYGYARDLTGTIYFDDFQIERGNQLSDWSPFENELSGAKYIFNGTNAIFKGGGLIIQNNAGGTVMTADTDGELWVQGYVKVGTTAVNAGLSGKGTLTTDIRIWAGWPTPSTSADFYVRDDGYMKAARGLIAGWSVNYSKIEKGAIILDATNERIYVGGGYFYNYGSSIIGSSGGLRCAGSFISAGNADLRNVYPNADNTYNLGASPSSQRWKYIYLINSPSVTSDIRSKSNVKVVEDDFTDMIFNTEVITYNLLEQENRSIGINANAFHAIFKEKAEFVVHQSEDGYYGADYVGFVPMLIKTVQQLNKRIQALEKGA